MMPCWQRVSAPAGVTAHSLHGGRRSAFRKPRRLRGDPHPPHAGPARPHSLGSWLCEEMHSRMESEMPRLAAVGRGPSRDSRAGGWPLPLGLPAASALLGTPPPSSSR